MSPHTLRRARSLAILSLVSVLALALPASAQIPPCGDGNLDILEQCDEGPDTGQPGACCTILCTFALASTPCRAAAGVCDLVDTCTGSSGTCVDDKSTAPCRAAAGVCDVAESCNGVGDDCPANGFEPGSVECRASAGVCDTAENCTGSGAACPADAKSTAVCRGAAGICDLAETCDGDEDDCPADDKSNALCRPSAGVCDLAESCDGDEDDCPADAFRSASVTCRGSGGNCDLVEHCTGSSAPCPADDKSTAVCRNASGICDVAESCDGVANTCPVNGFASASIECRAAAGVCDLAEHCTGSGASCPSDAKSTAVCRPAMAFCDAVESCDGDEDDCPADLVEPASVVCRASTGVCDPVEHCTGLGVNCPIDAKSTAVCRPSAGVCDVAESCDGIDGACPGDDFQSAATPCRADAGQCDVAELCTGSSAACPSNDFEPDETPCNDANVCSSGDRCIGGVCGGILDFCGNGAIDGSCFEQCDDGNQDSGDGCSGSCQFEPCHPAPLAGCRQLTTLGKASVQFVDREPDDKDRLQWKFSPGDTTFKSEFGNPLATTSYQFCIYDYHGGTPSLIASMHVPAGGMCGQKPCWKETGSGYAYNNKDSTPEGIKKIGLKQGVSPGKTRVQVQGRGANLPFPNLPFAQDGQVTLQLEASNGVCWQASYTAPAFRNLDTEFKDK